MIRDIADFAPARDGETLDTATFQCAIDTIDAEGGGTLWIGSGTCHGHRGRSSTRRRPHGSTRHPRT